MKRRIIPTLVFMTTFIFGYGLRSSLHNAPSAKYINGKRRVDSPTDLPKQRWKAVLRHTQRALKDKDLATEAAGLAYYATITFFPALLAIATSISFFADPEVLLRGIDALKLLLPTEIANLMHDQLGPLIASQKTALGVTALISILILLWTTSGGIQNLIKATNTAYDADESRSFWKLRSLSLLLTVGLIVLVGVILGLLLLKGDVLKVWGWPEPLPTIFPVLRWVLLAGLIALTLSIVYRYAPNRRNPKWQWVSWGAIAATIIWMIGSALFFFYVQNFANFGKTYGTFAGIIILMTWFNVSSLIVVLGAQVNHSLEKESQEP